MSELCGRQDPNSPLFREKQGTDIARQAAWDIYRYVYGEQVSQSIAPDSFEFFFAKILTAIVEAKAIGQVPKMVNSWEIGDPVNER